MHFGGLHSFFSKPYIVGYEMHGYCSSTSSTKELIFFHNLRFKFVEKEIVPAIPRTDASVKRFPAILSIQRLELGEFAGISVAFLVTPVSVSIVDAVYSKPVIPRNTARLRTLLHAFLKEIQYRIVLKL